ncbi:hypothetical protein L917_14342 [Phytophthora nicotianae]|uniref:RxLR effector protein n=1 Tax=Phytophthora nicotianae TaxID=4792 RepID=W2KPE2_PHYNI|nr:hypothetical protein L917_14342 [Phytophthora nicotianae]
MRLNSILLLTAAALFAYCDAASPSSLTKVSAMNAPDAVKVVDAKSARFLRSKHHKETVNTEGEERAAPVGLLDDVAKKFSVSSDDFNNWLRANPALLTKVATPQLSKAEKTALEASSFTKKITQELDRTTDVQFVLNWFKRQNLKPNEALHFAKSPAQKQAYAQYLPYYLKNAKNGVKPSAVDQTELSKPALAVYKKINADPDIKRMVDWWLHTGASLQTAKASINGDTGKQAYNLYTAVHANMKFGNNRKAWGFGL